MIKIPPFVVVKGQKNKEKLKNLLIWYPKAFITGLGSNINNRQQKL